MKRPNTIGTRIRTVFRNIFHRSAKGGHSSAATDESRPFTGETMRGHSSEDTAPLPIDRDVVNLEEEPLNALIQQAAKGQYTVAASAESNYAIQGHYLPDNVEIGRQALHQGFLVSFLVDARGGAMRGCRHSGVRIIVPPRKAPTPMRITCRYIRRDRLVHPPPLVEGEALASRVLEMGPAGAQFLGPIIVEVPHFASLRGREREVVILRSDDGEHWKEHKLEATEDAVQDVLNECFDADDLRQLEDLQTSRITRILTNDFPHYFAIITRIRQEVHAVGPEGGLITSTVVPRLQAVFPEGALTKTIKVSVQGQLVSHDLVTRLYGNTVAVSPILTVEPRRRKFHKPITLTLPLPTTTVKSATSDNLHDGKRDATLRLLCSITGGMNPAVWEDITGTTQMNFDEGTVSFTTTVSARFWLIDCQNITESAQIANQLYAEAVLIPYMAKFVIFARRVQPREPQIRVFCITDDREDKTLERQEHYTEVAKSREVEVVTSRPHYLEFDPNIVPMTKSGEQLTISFVPFQENRLSFNAKVKELDESYGESIAGRIAFMREPKYRADVLPPQHPICTLNLTLPPCLDLNELIVHSHAECTSRKGSFDPRNQGSPEKTQVLQPVKNSDQNAEVGVIMRDGASDLFGGVVSSNLNQFSNNDTEKIANRSENVSNSEQVTNSSENYVTNSSNNSEPQLVDGDRPRMKPSEGEEEPDQIITETVNDPMTTSRTSRSVEL